MNKLILVLALVAVAFVTTDVNAQYNEYHVNTQYHEHHVSAQDDDHPPTEPNCVNCCASKFPVSTRPFIRRIQSRRQAICVGRCSSGRLSVCNPNCGCYPQAPCGSTCWAVQDHHSRFRAPTQCHENCNAISAIGSGANLACHDRCHDRNVIFRLPRNRQ